VRYFYKHPDRSRGLLCLAAWFLLFASCLAYGSNSSIVPKSADNEAEGPHYLAAHPGLDQLNHATFTERDGAPSGVRDIFESPDGFLWMTSNDGLVRFDGIKFEKDLFPGFPHVALESVFVDDNGDIWVGMLHGGILLVHGGQVTTMSGDGLPGGTVFSVERMSDGHIWAVTTKGVARWGGRRWLPVTASSGYFPHHPDEIANTKDRSLWIEDDGSYYTFNASLATFKKVPWSLYIRRNLDIPTDISWLPDPNDGAYGVRDDFNANWVVTPRGLDRYRWGPEGKANIEHVKLLSGSSPEGIYKDRDGNVWVWTDAGLDRFRANTVIPLPHIGELSQPTIAPNGHGGLWAASWLGPLQILGTEQAQDASYLSKEVGVVYGAPDGTIWWADAKGVSSMQDGVVQSHPDHGIFGNPPRDAYQAMAVDSTGSLWVSIAGHGLFHLDHDQWESVLPNRTAITNGAPYAIAIGASGSVWLAGPGNRVTVILGKSVKNYGEQQGLHLGTVLSVLFAEGHIWVGGQNGVSILDGDKFRQIETSDEATLDGASGLAMTNGGDVWVNGSDGLFRINHSDVSQTLRDFAHVIHLTTFNSSDGLDGRAVQIRPFPTLAPSPDGGLWISTDLGAYWISASAIKEPNVTLHPLITRIMADDISVNVAHASLPLHTHSLQISFTAPYLSAAERVRFKYKLQGVDRSWQDSGRRREAFYTTLPPGRYVFQVLAMIGGVSNTQGGAFTTLIIPAAWYQTTFAKFALGVVIVACLVWLFIARSRRDARRARIRMTERERIARELHDTLLQGTQGLIFQISRALKLAKDPELRVMLIDAMERAQESLVDARGRVGELRGETTCWVDLGEAVTSAAKTIFLGHVVRFIPRFVGIPRMLDATVGNELLTMCQEAMSNALAHAKCRSVRLEINYSHKYLSITCSDDGQGIASPVLEDGGRDAHWGLTGMRERAALIKARIRVNSIENEGTTVLITVPGSVAYQHGIFSKWRRKTPKNNGCGNHDLFGNFGGRLG